MSDLPTEAHALFREPPEGFVAARDALAAGLKEDGRVDDAATVKRLRKPTVVAWALNGLAHAAGTAVEALLTAGAELRAAQQAAMSSERHAERLRHATSARRAAVGDLRRAAAAILKETGRASEAHLDQIVAALEAASVDPEAGEQLRTGTFERPPEAPAGFSDVFGLAAVPAPPQRRGTKEEGAGRAPEPDRAAVRAQVAKLRRDARAATTGATKAREAADRASRQLEELQGRLDKHRAKHDELRAAAEAAELERRRAERALDAATAGLDRLV